MQSNFEIGEVDLYKRLINGARVGPCAMYGMA